MGFPQRVQVSLPAFRGIPRRPRRMLLLRKLQILNFPKLLLSDQPLHRVHRVLRGFLRICDFGHREELRVSGTGCEGLRAVFHTGVLACFVECGDHYEEESAG